MVQFFNLVHNLMSLRFLKKKHLVLGTTLITWTKPNSIFFQNTNVQWISHSH